MVKANTFTAFSFLSALGIEGVSLGYLLALKSVFHFTIMSQCPHFMLHAVFGIQFWIFSTYLRTGPEHPSH